MILFNMEVTMQLFYLTVILLIIRWAIINTEYIDKKYTYVYLISISLLVNIIFYGFSFITIFESIIAVAFVSLIIEIYNLIKHIYL